MQTIAYTINRTMRRFSLPTLLITINVGLLLLTVAGLAWAAVSLLWRLVDEQALGRVTQASMSAQVILDRSARDTLAVAQLLSQRPTLRRLLTEQDTAALTAFLEQFQQTSQLDGCVVLRDGRFIVQTGIPLPAPIIHTLGAAGPPLFLRSPTPDTMLLLGAGAAIPALPGAQVIVVRQLNAHFDQQLTAEIGLPVTTLATQSIQETPPPEESHLYDQVRTTRQTVATRLPNPDRYIAAIPITTTTAGDIIGILTVTLPTTSLNASFQHLVQIMLVLALGVTVVAAGLNFALGRWLGRPLGRLTTAAARIGQGDLTTPIPRVAGQEIGTLAVTLEEMRYRLLHLMADLRQQQAESAAILGSIVEGVFSVDRDRTIRFINPQAGALLGIAPEAATGRFCGDVLNPRTVGGIRPCDDHCPIVHARLQPGARATEHLRLPNGQERTVVITSAPPTEGMQVQVLRDETDIEASRRLRDVVLANISHEFRTPLSAQLASIELLLDQLPSLSTAQVYTLVVTLQRSTLRLTQLIDNLLESARVEAGHATIRRSRVALDEVIETALELTRPLLDQRMQVVDVALPYPLPPLVGDAARLTQVFVNLLANANKFAPSGSTIEIGAAPGETTVTIWVADQGPGMPRLPGTDLFQRFVRAPDNEPEQSGMGLGLWICKSIIERHAGWIDAQSSETGTRMCVTLPVEGNHENSRRR